jgi:hypothetical protein
MTYNQWCEYAQFGQTCEYNRDLINFVEQYNNAKHQEFLNQIEDDKSNRSVQRTAEFWSEGRDILPTYGNGSNGTDEIYQRPNFQEVHTAVLRW